MRARFNLLKEASRLANRTFNDREIEEFLNKAQEDVVKDKFTAWKNRPQIGYGQHPVRNAELAGLITATQSVLRENFIVGDETNGALQGPDLDKGGPLQEADRWGVFVGLPNEMLYPITETCETVKGDVVKRNTIIKEINLQSYFDGIYDDFAKPYDNLVWSMDWGAYTTAEPTTDGLYDNSIKEFSSQGTNHNMSGLNYLGTAVNIDSNRARYLLPGKGWKVNKYTIHYIKLPRNIKIDVQTPSLQIHCELPAFVHDEVVLKAVAIASAAVIQDPNQYQVNDKLAKEQE